MKLRLQLDQAQTHPENYSFCLSTNQGGPLQSMCSQSEFPTFETWFKTWQWLENGATPVRGRLECSIKGAAG